MVNETKNILELFKPIVKEVLEIMLKEERKIYLEDNSHTKGNGYYKRGSIHLHGITRSNKEYGIYKQCLGETI